MESESLPEPPYSNSFLDGLHNVFVFTTVDDVVYEIKFVPSTDFFTDYESLDVNVFEMIIGIKDNPLGGRLRADRRVAPTIFGIFEAFFISHRQVFIYICDSSDGRAEVRHRKFDGWFFSQRAKFESHDIAKVDRFIKTDGDAIYLSLMMSRRNPKLGRVVDVFMNLGEEEK